MFMQMSVLVEQQDDTINVIETQAHGVEKDTEAGYVSLIISASRVSSPALTVLGTPKKLLNRPGPLARSDGFASSSFSSFSLSLL
jgi:hypothetical protein